MKYRFIVPGIYILLLLLFVFFFIKGAGGHSGNPFESVYYLTLPAGLQLELLPASWAPNNDLLLSLLFALAGLIQWALVGYLLDRLLGCRRKKNPLQRPT
jgi:ABC-type cobalt transport system substrate-binding protein